MFSLELKQEMEDDISKCLNQVQKSGSQLLYDSLISKYTVIDSDFIKGLPTMGKVIALPGEFDYRNDLKAIAEKLKMMLLKDSIPKNNNEIQINRKIKKFIEQGVAIKKIETTEFAGKMKISGEQYSQWMAEINLFSQRHLKEHPLYQEIQRTYFHRNANCAYDDMMGYLRTLEIDLGSDDSFNVQQKNSKRDFMEDKITMEYSNIFIVHGHDDLAKEQIARVVEKAGFEAIILHEKASVGKTIIEKIEEYSDVAFAVVLYTPCDIGYDRDTKEEHYRARQNVVFEHGYLMGKLGRKNVCALVKGEIETPGDISGVVYVPMDNAGAWKMDLAKEMKAAGLNIDFNKFL